MEILLKTDNLKKYFSLEQGIFRREVARVKAVDGVSFQIQSGETLGLVGESGCGKTTLGRLILRLLEPSQGEVYFAGNNIFKLSRSSFQKLRRDMQIIFQDPYNSLNPRMRIGEIIGEPLSVHNLVEKKQRENRVVALLQAVGLSSDYIKRYPHQASGGERQRVGIARALATQPRLIVCDEPVSSLDLSIQAQVLNLLDELQEEFHLTYLFITHNLSVIGSISDRIMVMYLGKIVEIAENRELFHSPLHPYTRALLQAAIAGPGPALKGDLPSPINPASGCRFRTRCPYADKTCAETEPPLKEERQRHFAACHKPLTSPLA